MRREHRYGLCVTFVIAVGIGVGSLLAARLSPLQRFPVDLGESPIELGFARSQRLQLRGAISLLFRRGKDALSVTHAGKGP